MLSDPEVLTLARAVLTKNRAEPWDSGRDSRGTASKKLSQSLKHAGTPNIEENQSHDATVPPSQAVGRGTLGQQQNPGTAPGTVVGQQYTQPAHHYSRVLAALQAECPAYVEIDPWQQGLADAEAWLYTPPERPAPSYQRFSRYDETGLGGRPVVALTAESAAIAASLTLQFGCPVEVLRTTLCRNAR